MLVLAIALSLILLICVVIIFISLGKAYRLFRDYSYNPLEKATKKLKCDKK